jgi:hypothetical protein
MLTRALLTLTLLFVSAAGAAPAAPAPAPAAAAHRERPRHARVVDEVEGCRVPPPSPEPVAPATCSDEARP